MRAGANSSGSKAKVSDETIEALVAGGCLAALIPVVALGRILGLLLLGYIAAAFVAIIHAVLGIDLVPMAGFWKTGIGLAAALGLISVVGRQIAMIFRRPSTKSDD